LAYENFVDQWCMVVGSLTSGLDLSRTTTRDEAALKRGGFLHIGAAVQGVIELKRIGDWHGYDFTG
jgi:hypothetical protein